MHIDYCRIEGGNFGDDLNLTLWRQLFPDIDHLNPNVVVAGIGTILSRKPSSNIKKVILGAGANGPKIKLNVNNSDIRWVRGPKSARAVGGAKHLGLGDPAWLYADLFEKVEPISNGSIGLIPHWKTWKSFDWQRVANNAGLIGIDASLHPAQVVHKMRSCSRILTESLHGAVFADAMGIPWAPAVLAHRFHKFKWEDWTESIHREFVPFMPDRALVHSVGKIKSLTNWMMREAQFGLSMREPALRAIKAASPSDEEQVSAQLFEYCSNASNFFCSDPVFVKAQREKMLDVCAKFAKDYGLRFSH